MPSITVGVKRWWSPSRILSMIDGLINGGKRLDRSDWLKQMRVESEQLLDSEAPTYDVDWGSTIEVKTRLTNNPADDGLAAWSPDGTRIAFGSDREGNFDFYVMNADGSGLTRLTINVVVDFRPSWSPTQEQ